MSPDQQPGDDQNMGQISVKTYALKGSDLGSNQQVKVYGLYSVEFDDAGTISVSFVPVRPGEYPFYVPGYEKRGLAGKFIVR
ncbi:MAG TPA: hypothetical protein VLZ53_11755 [Devosia sp.]|nr:hypothetical protein [Devosia sp.]